MKTYHCENFDMNNPEILEYTEAQILDEYWDHWYTLMVKKYGEGHELITKEKCIENWAVVNWAWEVNDE